MPGVSKGKTTKYGKPFVDLIARYVEENNIERPDDFVMKSVVNKSGNKVYIIQNTDKRCLSKPSPKQGMANRRDAGGNGNHCCQRH